MNASAIKIHLEMANGAEKVSKYHFRGIYKGRKTLVFRKGSIA